MQRIKDNLLKVSQNVVGHIKNLQETVQKREEERVFYDHYRAKLTKMEKAGGESTSADPEAQQKYARNQSKFDQTKSKFELLSTQLNEELQKIETRIERVTVDLTFKFSKEVQLAFYREMNQVFFRLRDIESEMVDQAHLELVKKREQEQKAKDSAAKAQRAVDGEYGGSLDKYNDPNYLAGVASQVGPTNSTQPSTQAPVPNYGQQYGAQDQQYNQYGAAADNNYDNQEQYANDRGQQYGANANHYGGDGVHQDAQNYD